VLGLTAAMGETQEEVIKLPGAHPEGACLEQRVEPVDEEITQKELVASHVPQQDRLPYVKRASGLGEDHECTITISRIEPSVEYFSHIAQPSGASDAEDIILAQMIEILAFGLVEVPGREGGVRLGDHRALDKGE
jgi:hypothetical protein